MLITPGDLIALRTDPIKYKDGTCQEALRPQDMLLSLMIYSPELFSDMFIEKIERPDIEGVEYIEALAENLNFILKQEESLDVELLRKTETALKKKYGLAPTFDPSPGLIAYREYLLMRQDRVVVTSDDVKKANERVKAAKNGVGVFTIGEEIKSPYNFAQKCHRFGKQLYYKNIIVTSGFSAEIVGLKIQLESFLSLLVIDEGTSNGIIKNIISFDKIQDFPEHYRKNRLDLLAGYQQQLLKFFGINVEIVFLAATGTNCYTFQVKNFPDMVSEITKGASLIKMNNFTVPYEYTSFGEPITL